MSEDSDDVTKRSGAVGALPHILGHHVEERHKFAVRGHRVTKASGLLNVRTCTVADA